MIMNTIELRENSTDFMRNQSSDNFQNRDLSKNFDQNAFENRIYEENRMEDIHDQGYEKWMKKIKQHRMILFMISNFNKR